MRPTFHPRLVNGPFEDPALYVEFLFQKRALLFDLGELTALPPRKILALTQIFVSHTHMDHFAGFDRVLRIALGRPRRLALYGPPGFIDQVEHKLAAYTWNLAPSYAADFTLEVHEVGEGPIGRWARFRCSAAFAREEEQETTLSDGVLVDEPGFRVRTAMLDHRIPCLAFSLEEKLHVNVWKNRLEERALVPGPWLRELKAAVVRGDPDSTPIRVVQEKGGSQGESTVCLGELRRSVLQVVPGQKITYVVDAVFHEHNAERIVELARSADQLFIETTFLEVDADRAAATYHLTARQAGYLGQAAGVKRLIPFHFSPRYSHRERDLREEVLKAFQRGSPASPN